jgi:prepilin-type N-terminal cleavage/methylation domain-containing protein
MEFKPTVNNRTKSGFSLVEMMVAAGVGSLFLVAMAMLYMFSMRSFAAMANYADFGRRSRYASDILSRDIRRSLYVVSATNNQIVLSAPDGTNISYTFSPTLRNVTRVKGSDNKVLLKNVAWVAFALYLPPATNAVYNTFATTTTAADAKMVGFQFSCSQPVQGLESNSEDIQTAIVSMRNR